MTDEEHIEFAKKALSFLVTTVKEFKGGNKFITYGDLAKGTNYPTPYQGSFFGKRIGTTLGVMGHLFEEIQVPDWQGRIPFIQAMVVGQNSKFPSDGLKEFNSDYPNFSNKKKKDYASLEYQKIFEFGERWQYVLKKLEIEEHKNKESNHSNKKNKKTGKFNPYGSEGSPEHRRLRDYVAKNPRKIGLEFLESGKIEYPLKSGDSIDVVFETEDTIIGVEVKSIRSGEDDHERGIFQCIKYREVLKAEEKINNKARVIDCILIHEEELTKKLIKAANKLEVEHLTLKIN